MRYCFKINVPTGSPAVTELESCHLAYFIPIADGIPSQCQWNFCTMLVEYPHDVGDVSIQHWSNFHTMFMEFLHNVGGMSKQSWWNSYAELLKFLYIFDISI